MSKNRSDIEIKEKFKQALTSTVKVISEDFNIKENSKKKDSQKFDPFEIDSLNNKNDFIKARATSDSKALINSFGTLTELLEFCPETVAYASPL